MGVSRAVESVRDELETKSVRRRPTRSVFARVLASMSARQRHRGWLLPMPGAGPAQSFEEAPAELAGVSDEFRVS
ncbi:MAG: hypothetical protein ACLPV4_06245 [Solirubrobacteraceae bacterium]